MAWTTPRTWVNGETIDASIMNTHIRDNLNYLKTQVAAHFILSGASIIPSTTNGCKPPAKTEFASNGQNMMLTEFSASAKQYGEWFLPYLPDDYGGGTITAKFIWTHNLASFASNTVVWGLQARAYADGDSIDAAWGTAQEVTDAPHSSLLYTMRVSAATSPITIGNTPAAGKACQFRAYRDGAGASDTYGSVSYLLGVAINYTRA